GDLALRLGARADLRELLRRGDLEAALLLLALSGGGAARGELLFFFARLLLELVLFAERGDTTGDGGGIGEVGLVVLRLRLVLGLHVFFVALFVAHRATRGRTLLGSVPLVKARNSLVIRRLRPRPRPRAAAAGSRALAAGATRRGCPSGARARSGRAAPRRPR